MVGVHHWFTPGITVLGGDVGGRSGGGAPLVHSGGSLPLVVMLEVEVVGVYHWFTPGDHCPWW